MLDHKIQCRRNREALLEMFLSEGDRARLPAEHSNHLQGCAACRRYWENLNSVRSGFEEDPLYSPFLREKTLRRLAGRKAKSKLEWLPLIIFASLISFLLSFVLPGWVLLEFYGRWTSSFPVACAAAFGTLLMAGALVTAIATLSLIERGYIQFNNGQEAR